MFRNNVLIVDDIPENINVATNFLMAEELDVSIAMSGQEAIDAAMDSPPDLILLDIMMPGMDGFETLEELQKDEKTKDIPVIFVTAKNDPDSVVKGLEAGAVDYITKPFNSAELLARVNTHLTIRDQQHTLAEQEQKLRSIYDNAHDPIFIVQNRKIVFYNRRLPEMSGYNSQEIKKLEFSDLINAEDRPKAEAFMEQVLNGDLKTKYVVLKARTKNEELIHIKVNTQLIDWEDEKAILVLTDNISAQVKAEERLFQINANLEKLVKERTEKLEQSEQNFVNLFEKSSDALILNDFDGNIINANQTAVEMLGYSKKELKAMKTSQIMRRRSQKSRMMHEKLKDQNSTVYQIENVSKGGEKIPVEIRSTIVDYFDKKLILSAGRDITERINAEKIRLETIIQTEERERNRFAKDLHDGLGATLSATKMYLNIVKRTDSNGERAKKMLDEAITLLDKASKNAKEIAVNILPHDLAHFGLVSSLANFCERINEIKTVKVHFDAAGYKNILEINEELQLFRTVNELINNTFKYADAENIHIILEQKRNKVSLFYRDDGNGFDYEKVLNANKSGIGLENIIERARLMNGNAIIDSKPGEGMTAKIHYIVDDERLNDEDDSYSKFS